MYSEGLRALDQFGNYGSPVRRRDDVTLSAFVAQELTDIIPQNYDRLFPELEAKTHIPSKSDIAPGAMAWAYDQMDRRGRAKWLGANATDMPRVDVSKKRKFYPIRTSVLCYGWNVEEMDAARFSGMPLDSEKAIACRRGQAEFEDQVLFNGDAEFDIPGFLTNPATPRVVLPKGAWLGGVTTPPEVLADLHWLADRVYEQSAKVHKPNTMLLPLSLFRYVLATPYSAYSDKTIAAWFLSTSGWVRELMTAPYLDTAGPGGKPTILCYQKDPGILGGVIPLAYQEMDPQVHGFEAVIPTRQKEGGCVWFYPFAAAFGDGA